jgi:hypothetical protein
MHPVRTQTRCKSADLCNLTKEAILAIISRISAILTMSQQPTAGAAPITSRIQKKKRCVTEAGCDEYKARLCEPFSMGERVTSKGWNTETKRGELWQRRAVWRRH